MSGLTLLASFTMKRVVLGLFYYVRVKIRENLFVRVGALGRLVRHSSLPLCTRVDCVPVGRQCLVEVELMFYACVRVFLCGSSSLQLPTQGTPRGETWNHDSSDGRSSPGSLPPRRLGC